MLVGSRAGLHVPTESHALTPGEEKVSPQMQVPFFRCDLNDIEIDEVVDSLRSGWLTTGPKVRRFEENLAAAVGAPHAVAVNSGDTGRLNGKGGFGFLAWLDG